MCLLSSHRRGGGMLNLSNSQPRRLSVIRFMSSEAQNRRDRSASRRILKVRSRLYDVRAFSKHGRTRSKIPALDGHYL
jgi:hypothetical protein